MTPFELKAMNDALQCLERGDVAGARKLILRLVIAADAEGVQANETSPAPMGEPPPDVNDTGEARRARLARDARNATPASLRREGFDASWIQSYRQTLARDPMAAAAELEGGRDALRAREATAAPSGDPVANLARALRGLMNGRTAA